MPGSVSAIVSRLRDRGVRVHEWGGWQSRGTGQSYSWRGGIIHHTASAYGSAYQMLVAGRSDLAGPLCNFSCNSDGSVTVIAAGVANHAGRSGGRSMGPLPVTTAFNKYVVGLEIVYPGDKPMTAAQYRTACKWARVVADVCGGGNIESVRAHAETSVTGKWDPGYAPGKTIDMARFRRDAKVIFNAPPEEDMTPDQDTKLDVIFRQISGKNGLADKGWGWPSWVDGKRVTPIDYLRLQQQQGVRLAQELAALRASLTTLADAVAAKINVKAGDILKQIDDSIKAAVIDVDVTISGGSGTDGATP